MITQRQPNRWSCVPTAFAIVINMPVSKLIELIGHDGGEIVRPDYTEPSCRKGFNVMECIYVLHEMGYSVTPFDAMPATAVDNGKAPLQVWSKEESLNRFTKILNNNSGVITGYMPKAHAVAWDGSCIHNPGYGIIQDISHIKIETLWVIQSVSKITLDK